MNHYFNNFIRGVRDLKLSDTSFARIRTTLASYADLHAIPERGLSAARPSPFMVFITARRTSYAGALLLFIFVTGGGAALGAEGAVPGDALYGLKTKVNEKVITSFANSNEERARVSAQLATRRADEAIVLLKDGRLDEETALYLGQELATHVEQASEEADALEAEGDVSASLRVRTELEGQLTARAYALTPPEPQEPEAATMMMAADTNVRQFAKTAAFAPSHEMELAESFRAQAGKIAEARLHTEISLLPGIAATADVDLSQFGGADENEVTAVTAVAASDADSAAVMLTTDANATSTIEQAPMRAKTRYEAPNNAWPSGGAGSEVKPLWLNKGY
ncbi:MAG: DUF5667 domain-containing protein [Patescibacteria group bacterium]